MTKFHSYAKTHSNRLFDSSSTPILSAIAHQPQTSIYWLHTSSVDSPHNQIFNELQENQQQNVQQQITTHRNTTTHPTTYGTITPWTHVWWNSLEHTSLLHSNTRYSSFQTQVHNIDSARNISPFTELIWPWDTSSSVDSILQIALYHHTTSSNIRHETTTP